MCDVPCDLVREILVNLPAKSVFRLRSVCKEWLTIIEDPSFIKAHTITKNQLYNHTLVVGDGDDDSWYSLCLDSLNFITNGSQMIDATPIKNPYPRIRNLSISMAPCNGLIMYISEVIGKRDMLVIRNPLTKEYHELPHPNDALTNAYGYAYGFGYDSGSDDYKVVRIDRLSYSLGKFVFQTLVYSLKSNSWRTAEDSPFSVQGKGSLLDGVLYWISKYYWVIFALDLGTERYCQLPLPMPPVSGHRSHDWFDLRLDALDGCLICSLVDYPKSIFCGWVMKDNGVEKSWIKLLSLQYSLLINKPGGLRLVSYLKRKQQVVLQNLGTFLWYNVANNSIKKFSIHGRNITSSLICSGSLVRLSHYHGGDTTLSGKNTKTKRTDTRLKFCVRNAEEMCCSDYKPLCSEDACLHCKEE